MVQLRVLQGRHVQSHPTEKNSEGNPLDIMYGEGQTFENEQDLAARWPEKFGRVNEGDSESVDRIKSLLDKLSVAELRAICEEDEVEVPDDATKEQLVAAVRRHRRY